MRRATLEDIRFITYLMLHDAEQGHYLFRSERQIDPAQFIAQITSALISEYRVAHQGHALEGEVWIEEVDGLPAAAAVVVDAPPALSQHFSSTRSRELWMISVAPEFRGRGLGSRLLDSVLLRLPQDDTLIARCAPASSRMNQMLLKRSFLFVARTTDNFAILARGNTVCIQRTIEQLKPKPRPVDPTLRNLTVATSQ